MAKYIGIDKMMSECKHFSAWINKIIDFEGKRQKGSVLKNTESGYNNLTPCLNSQGIEYSRIMFCVHVDFLKFR